MKNLIFVFIFVFLMITCSESTTGPIDPNPEDPEPTDTIAEISIDILNWGQEYDGDSHPWGNVQVIYMIKNTGDIPIENYTMYWVFDGCDSLDICADSWIKIIYCSEILDVEEEKTDTINSGDLTGKVPIKRIRCNIRDINS